MIRASNWKPLARNTLVGFCDLHLETSGLVLHDCSYHRHPDGREWVALPSKPQLGQGQHRKNPATGKALYTPVVEIAGKEARERFQAAALAAVRALLDEAAS